MRDFFRLEGKRKPSPLGGRNRVFRKEPPRLWRSFDDRIIRQERGNVVDVDEQADASRTLSGDEHMRRVAQPVLRLQVGDDPLHVQVAVEPVVPRVCGGACALSCVEVSGAVIDPDAIPGVEVRVLGRVSIYQGF